MTWLALILAAVWLLWRSWPPGAADDATDDVANGLIE